MPFAREGVNSEDASNTPAESSSKNPSRIVYFGGAKKRRWTSNRKTVKGIKVEGERDRERGREERPEDVENGKDN